MYLQPAVVVDNPKCTAVMVLVAVNWYLMYRWVGHDVTHSRFSRFQARLAELETPKKMEHLHRLDELKKRLVDLEKQVSVDLVSVRNPELC